MSFPQTITTSKAYRHNRIGHNRQCYDCRKTLQDSVVAICQEQRAMNKDYTPEQPERYIWR